MMIKIRPNVLLRLVTFVHLIARQITNAQTSPPTSLAPTFTPPGRGEWYIVNDGPVSLEPLTTELMFVTIPFNATNRGHGALVFESDCVTPLDCNGCYEVNTTTPSSNKPDGYIQFDTTVTVNITELNNTGHFNEFYGQVDGGWAALCIETFLCFKETIDLGNSPDNGLEGATKIDFKNNLVIMTVYYETDTTFNIGNPTNDTNATGVVGGIQLMNPYENINYVNGTTEERDIFIGFSKFIRAYECEESNLYAPASLTYNQGDEIMICVTDKSNGIVYVDQFFDLKVSQPGSGLSDYYFIRNSIWNPTITTPKCQNGPTANKRRVCTAKILALGRFFPSFEKPPDLVISGSIFLYFEGRRVRRNLKMTLPSSAYDDKDKKYSDFIDNYEGQIDELAINNALPTGTSLGRRRDADLDNGGGEFKVKVSLINKSSPDSIGGGLFDRLPTKSTATVTVLSVAAGVIGAVAISVFINRRRK